MKAPRNVRTAPAMDRETWEAIAQDNPGFAHFLPYERMRQPETVKPVEPPAKATRWAMYSRIAKKAGKQ